LRIDSSPQPATVSVKSEFLVSQSTPGNFCDLQPGLTYKLSVFRRGFETRYLKFSFSDYGQPPDISGIWLGMVGRSAVLPGWGQKTMGQASRSLETWVLLIADGFKVWQVYQDYSHAKSQYKNMKVLTQASETQQEAEDRALRTNKLAQDTNAYRENLILTAAVGGWVYLHNVVETYTISASPKTTKTEGSDFKVSIPKKSAGRAALQSLFFPGLGQRYVGHSGRGFLFRSGVFVLALFTIDAKLRYDLAVSDRNHFVTQFNNTTSVPGREAMLPEMLIRQESVESRKDRTIAFAAATGLLWLANVFEAWGSGGGESDDLDRLETSTTYRNSTVYQEIRFRF
jgi:TM2 domain-containing membrane protein YozV